ncbi:hypothetical protein niasHT_036151 [Heterodera trifolii]|uniref:Uncharacterized protein n=1 Tax=Heterodera trifolii TaxID=157864 RepID=A0ABD2J0H0_9BILA
MMGIECVRSTAPRPWDSESERFHQVHHSSDGYGRDGIGTHPSMSGDATATVILPHSAPSSSCGFGSRRAASFPLASAVLISAHLPSSHAAKIYQQQQMAAGNLKFVRTRKFTEFWGIGDGLKCILVRSPPFKCVFIVHLSIAITIIFIISVSRRLLGGPRLEVSSDPSKSLETRE